VGPLCWYRVDSRVTFNYRGLGLAPGVSFQLGTFTTPYYPTYYPLLPYLLSYLLPYYPLLPLLPTTPTLGTPLLGTTLPPRDKISLYPRYPRGPIPKVTSTSPR
jgi:hypothetical protein